MALTLVLTALLFSSGSAASAQHVANATGPIVPLAFDETLTIASKVLAGIRYAATPAFNR
jgi:hypothetical protein